jgi:zinc/manganese transport system substrate-binding protein
MVLITCAVLLTLGAAAEDSSPVVVAATRSPVVVATTSIWADIVDELDCEDHFTVDTLIPVGGDAHSFEPSVRDRAALEDAVLVVANGGGLEEHLDDTLDAVASDTTAVLRVVDHLGDEDDDPHVWFDPTIVAHAAPAIADELVAAGADRATTDRCLDEFTGELEALDAELSDTLAAIPAERRLLVTNHDSLGRFAERYDLEVLGSVIPGSSTLAEASPADLEQLAEDIEATGVAAIFTEALETTDEATTLADRLGIDVVTLYTDSLGEEGSGAETYADLMRFNATAIAEALSP